MNHTGAETLDIATMFADTASGTMAKATLHVDPHPGADFWVVFVAETQHHIGTK